MPFSSLARELTVGSANDSLDGERVSFERLGYGGNCQLGFDFQVFKHSLKTPFSLVFNQFLSGIPNRSASND